MSAQLIAPPRPRSLISRHPLIAFFAWFLTMGQAFAFAPLLFGLLLIVPGAVQLIPAVGRAIGAVLPTSLGQVLYLPLAQVGLASFLVGIAGLMAWVAGLGAAALVSFGRRDV